MAIDWGSLIGGVVGEVFGKQQPGIGAIPYVGATMPQPAQKVEVDLATGQVKPCRKRRRRRRLLTPTDLSDLAALQAIVGKGDALKLAVAKAVRR